MKGLWIAVYYMCDTDGVFIHKFKTRKEARAKLKSWRDNKLMADKGTWKLYREWTMPPQPSQPSMEKLVWVRRR